MSRKKTAGDGAGSGEGPASVSRNWTDKEEEISLGPKSIKVIHPQGRYGNGCSPVAFNHDGSRIAAVWISQYKTIYILPAESPYEIDIKGYWVKWKEPSEKDSDEWLSRCLKLEGHSDWVRSVAFNHDGSRLVSASYDTTCKVWDANTGTVIHTLEGHSDAVRSVAFNHDGSRIVSGSLGSDKTCKVWDANTGDCLKTLEGHSEGVNSIAFNHDGSRIVSGSLDMTAMVWDANTGECLTIVSHSDHGNPNFSVQRNQDGLGWRRSRILVPVLSVAFNHDGSRIVSGSEDKTCKVWDANTGGCLQTLEGHSDEVTSVAFSPHSSDLVVSSSLDGYIKLWSVSSGEVVRTLRKKTDFENYEIYSAAVSADGSSLVAGVGDMINVIDVDLDLNYPFLREHEVEGVMIQAFRGENYIKVKVAMPGHPLIFDVMLSKDGIYRVEFPGNMSRFRDSANFLKSMVGKDACERVREQKHTSLDDLIVDIFNSANDHFEETNQVNTVTGSDLGLSDIRRLRFKF